MAFAYPHACIRARATLLSDVLRAGLVDDDAPTVTAINDRACVGIVALSVREGGVCIYRRGFDKLGGCKRLSHLTPLEDFLDVL